MSSLVVRRLVFLVLICISENLFDAKLRYYLSFVIYSKNVIAPYVFCTKKKELSV